MSAQEIIDAQLNSWGERLNYLVNESEFCLLLSEGGKIEVLNQDNGDGTFFSSLVFSGRTFYCSSIIALIAPAAS